MCLQRCEATEKSYLMIICSSRTERSQCRDPFPTCCLYCGLLIGHAARRSLEVCCLSSMGMQSTSIWLKFATNRLLMVLNAVHTDQRGHSSLCMCRRQDGWLQHCGDFQQECGGRRARPSLATGVWFKAAEANKGKGSHRDARDPQSCHLTFPVLLISCMHRSTAVSGHHALQRSTIVRFEDGFLPERKSCQEIW